MMAEQKFFFILLLSGLCCLAIAPLFLFRNSERNSVSLTAPGLMLIGIAFVLIGCCGFVGQLRGLISKRFSVFYQINF